MIKNQISLISHQLRHQIYEYLDFHDLKRLLFLCKLLYVDLINYLHTNQNSLDQSFGLNSNRIQYQSQLLQFKNIRILQVITFNYDLILLCNKLPRQITKLIITDSEEKMYDQFDFLQILFSRCKNLEYLKLQVEDKQRFQYRIRSLNHQFKEFITKQNFLKNALNLKVFKVKNYNQCLQQKTQYLYYNLFYVLTHYKHYIKKIQLDFALFKFEDYYNIQSNNLEYFKLSTKFEILDSITFNQCGMNHNTLVYLIRGFPQLKSLCIINTINQPVVINDLNTLLIKFTQIRKLSFNCYKSNLQLNEIAIMLLCNELQQKQILAIGLSGCKGITTSSVQQIIDCNQFLNEINFDYTMIDDIGLIMMQNIIGKLEKLSLKYCKRLTNYSLLQVFSQNNLSNLKQLNVRGLKQFDQNCVFSLQTAVNMEKIFFHDNCLSDDALISMITIFKKIKQIEISKLDDCCDLFTKYLFDKCIQLNIKLSRHLQKLDIAINHTFDDQTILKLSQCIDSKIEELNLNGCNLLTDQTLNYLSLNPQIKRNLRSINISQTQINKKNNSSIKLFDALVFIT